MVNLADALAASGKPSYQGKLISPQACQENGLTPYLPSPELINAVNLAIFLEKRPLLLKGEPGCGKTRLAQAVAYELGLPYEPWYIKSTSRARDGLYTYDAVRRLHDAQLVRMGEKSQSKVDDLNNYIEMGALGRAFENAQRTVVSSRTKVLGTVQSFVNATLTLLRQRLQAFLAFGYSAVYLCPTTY